MFNFLKKKHYSAGVQITDQLVRFVSFEVTKDKVTLRDFGEEFLSAGVVIEGRIADPEKLTHVLSMMHKKYDLREVTVVLPEEQSFIFYTNVPLVPGEELQVVIQDHIASYLRLHSKLSLRDLVCEYDVVGETDGNYEVQVTVTPANLVESYVHVFEAAGMEPSILEVGSHMTSRGCVADNEGGTCMVVDFGADRTHVSVVSDTTVMKSSTLPVGHEHVGPVIEKFLNINSHEAGRIKSKYGVLRTHKEPALLSEILHELAPIRDYLDRQFVEWHTKKYKGKKERNPIDKIILHGEGAHLRGFAEHLASSTRIPVEKANVWSTLPGFEDSIPHMHKNETLRYATAISAALEGI